MVVSGFELNSINSTHDRIVFEDMVNGTFNWFFLTENAVTNLLINPDEFNGTLNNVSVVDYNIEVANGSIGIPNSPVKIEIIDFAGTILDSDNKSTNANGWLNSTTDTIQFSYSANNTYWLRASSLNETFRGVMVKRFYAYNDWSAPVVNNIVYEDSLVAGDFFVCDIYVVDDYTELADLSLIMDYSFVSSGTLTETSALSLEGDHYEVSLIGQDAGTTIWFQITILDNLSNSFESIIYQAEWLVAEEVAPSGGGDGNGVSPVVGQPSGGGIPDVVLLLLFASGAIATAVVGYAVLQRVQVRTRRVETREVITGLGTFGRTQEKIVVKGRKPKKKKKRKKK
jgi:hypothetical protein